MSQIRDTDTLLELTETVPVDPRQLAFRFVDGDRDASLSTSSRRSPRSEIAGRVARLPVLERLPEEVRLEKAVAAYLPPDKSLRLTLTDNSYNIVAVRRESAGYAVRIHRVFSDVEPRLVRALARYVVHNDRRASEALGEFIDRNLKVIQQTPRRPRKVSIKVQGRVHNLQEVFDSLNQQYFQGALQAQITWGPARFRANQRSMKMGSFAVEDRIIRIHPALDREDIPRFFLEWIVFHEMLHGRLEIRRKAGRRCFHPPEFLAQEREFADFERASAWEKDNVDKLFQR
jgi:hypothetical protein